jgi:hypothetical protein
VRERIHRIIQCECDRIGKILKTTLLLLSSGGIFFSFTLARVYNSLRSFVSWWIHLLWRFYGNLIKKTWMYVNLNLRWSAIKNLFLILNFYQKRSQWNDKRLAVSVWMCVSKIFISLQFTFSNFDEAYTEI